MTQKKSDGTQLPPEGLQMSTRPEMSKAFYHNYVGIKVGKRASKRTRAIENAQTNKTCRIQFIWSTGLHSNHRPAFKMLLFISHGDFYFGTENSVVKVDFFHELSRFGICFNVFWGFGGLNDVLLFFAVEPKVD